MPALIENTKKQEAGARIKKFVSVINQAIVSAENDYGMREDWVIGEINNSDASFEFLNTYIKPYIKSFEIEKRQLLGRNMATLRFVDGSQMSIKIGSCYDIYYDINGEKKPNVLGRDIFPFILCRKDEICNLKYNGVQAFYCQISSVPYPTHEQMVRDCKTGDGTYCTLLLQENQWEFPKDYPRRL